MRNPAIKAPTGAQPPPLKPGQARRHLSVVRGEDADTAIARAKVMPWGGAIVGRPINCSRPGRGAVWTFTIREAPSP